MNSTVPFDPKTEVTEHAFVIPSDVLGQPLATPWKRAVALGIDLLIVGAMHELGMVTLSALIAVLGYRRMRNLGLDSRFAKVKNRMWAFGTGVLLFVASVSVLGIFDSDDSPKKGGIKVETDIMGNSEEFDWSKISELESLKNGDSLSFESLENIAREVEKVVNNVSPIDFKHEKSTIETSSIYAYAESVDEQKFEEADSLRPIVSKIVSAPEFSKYRKSIGILKSEKSDLKDQVEELTDKVENPSMLSVVFATANDLGVAFGWSSLYFIFSLAWFKGQTIGKRLLKLRVIKLNGKDLSVWFSFERLGGYAAGLATGLLGFAQIFWDPNRQGIHDKIAGTVVVDESKKGLE